MAKCLFHAITEIRSRRRRCPFRAIRAPCPKTLPAPLVTALPLTCYATVLVWDDELNEILCSKFQLILSLSNVLYAYLPFTALFFNRGVISKSLTTSVLCLQSVCL